jgi:hypothetical protein
MSFAYQRHLISGIGFFFVVLIFAVDEYQRRSAIRKEKQAESILFVNDEPPSHHEQATNEEAASQLSPAGPSTEADPTPDTPGFAGLPSWIFAGVLIGLLPYWNSPTFIAGLDGVWMSAPACAFAQPDCAAAWRPRSSLGCRRY